MENIHSLTGDYELIKDISVFQKEGDIILDVPTYVQLKNDTCGFVAAAMVTRTFYPKTSLQTIWNCTRPSENDGVSTTRLISGLRKLKLTVKKRNIHRFNDFASLIEAGFPILTTVKRSTCAHWVVVYGVNPKRREIILAVDGIPYLAKHRFKWSEFKEREGESREFIVCKK